MSLYPALVSLLENWRLPDKLPTPVLGIPDNFLEGPYPNFFIEPSEERFDSKFLQVGSDDTQSDADVIAVITVNRRTVPQSTEVLPYLMGLVEELRTLLKSLSREGVFCAAPDRGFGVYAASVLYYYKSNDPTAAARITLRVTEYQ